ncbi:MAG: hypothetical protein HY900_09865 [Deltaproteobacteria bacterium]|nr:hypothetical protein [Deltaproteobacteria bacterium]
MLSTVGRGVLVLSPVLLVLGGTPAFAVNFGALWLYRASGGTGTETTTSLEERYTLGAGPDFLFQPTNAISLRGDVTYGRSQSRLADGSSQTAEQLTPSGTLSVANDIFRGALFGTDTERRSSGGVRSATRAWEATLASAWQQPFWPSLRSHYGVTSEVSDGQAVERETRYGAGFDWDVKLAKLYYDYSHSQFDDLESGSRNVGDSHFARLETGGKFWQNRIALTLSQQFQQRTSHFSVGDLAADAFERPLEGATLSLAPLPPPTAATPFPDPTTVVMTNNDALGDGRKTADAPATLTIVPGGRGHLGIHFPFQQQVDRLDVYVRRLDSLTEGQLTWDLYRKRGVGDWVLIGTVIPVVNRVESRFEFPVGTPEQDLMLVVTVSPAALVPLEITELQAIRLLSADESDVQRSYLTNVSMKVRITPTLTASSAAALERTDSELSGAAVRRTVSGNVRWSPSPALEPSVAFSESRQVAEGTPEAISRTYSVTVLTYPLSRMAVSLGATRSDEFSDARRTSTSDRYSLVTSARIYPDLTAAFDASYRTTSREQPDSTTLTTDVLSTRLTLNARLTPKLTGDLTTTYDRAESTTVSSTLSLGYRPTDLLSMRLTLARDWTDREVPDSLLFTTNLALLRTEKTTLSFQYDHSQGIRKSDRFGLTGSWDISRRLILQTLANYVSAETSTWNVESSLSLAL